MGYLNGLGHFNGLPDLHVQFVNYVITNFGEACRLMRKTASKHCKVGLGRTNVNRRPSRECRFPHVNK